MSLEDIVNVAITAQTSSPTRPGFGTPLIVAYHTRWTSDLVREYASTAEMADDGFLVTDPTYLCAQAVFSQSPRPKKVKVGRRTRAFTQAIKLTPTITTEGYVYRIVIGGETLTYAVPGSASVASICAALTAAVGGMDGGGTEAVKASLVVDGVGPGRDGEVTYTAVTAGTAGNSITIKHVVAGSETPLSVVVTDTDIVVNLETNTGNAAISTAAEVVAAIAGDEDASALVTAAVAPIDDDGDAVAAAVAETPLAGGAAVGAGDWLAADHTTYVSVTANAAGVLFDYADWSNGLTFEDVTPNPGSGGIAADLVDIRAEDDDWYGLLLDSNSKPQVVAAAAAVESMIKLFGYTTSDTVAYDANVTSDVFSTLKASNYARSFGLLSSKRLLSWGAAAWMGNRFPFDPGSDTWAFKTLRGVVTDVLSSGKVTAVLNKRGNVYTAVAGLSVTQFGKSASGEWVDTTRFVDWLRSELQIRLFALLVNNQKIPYTDLGVDLVKSVINAVLKDGVRAGGLAADPAPEVTAPVVADVDSITKGDRILPDVKFSATLAGAIHSLVIDGTLSV